MFIKTGDIIPLSMEEIQLLDNDGTIRNCVVVGIDAQPGNPRLDRIIFSLGKDIDFGYSFDDLGESYQDIIKIFSPERIKNGEKFFGMQRYVLVDLINKKIAYNKNTNIPTKEKTMANKLVDTLKDDAKEAAYRVAGTQITNGVKAALVKVFDGRGGKSEQMEMFKALLDSEVGDSLISLILGFGLNYAPKLKDDPRVQKLSEEFRINGMSVAGNAIVGAAMDTLLPVLNSALQSLPEEENSNARITEASEEEEEEETAAKKVASR